MIYFVTCIDCISSIMYVSVSMCLYIFVFVPMGLLQILRGDHAYSLSCILFRLSYFVLFISYILCFVSYILCPILFRYSENAGVTPPVIKSRFTLAYEDELLVGDCTAHHGWTYHSASAQPENNRERWLVLLSCFGAALVH